LRRLVTIDDETVHLTPIEYGLLRELAKNQDSVITHDQLLQSVWGKEYRDSVPYLHVYVGRLRNKLSAANGAKIVSKSGVGYMLKTQP
jgi:two-component system KDP operon response regulator KdpE